MPHFDFEIKVDNVKDNKNRDNSFYSGSKTTTHWWCFQPERKVKYASGKIFTIIQKLPFKFYEENVGN